MLAQDEGRLEIPQTPLSALMSMEVVTIGADTKLSQAADIMLEHGFSALPVVRDGRLAGGTQAVLIPPTRLLRPATTV